MRKNDRYCVAGRLEFMDKRVYVRRGLVGRRAIIIDHLRTGKLAPVANTDDRSIYPGIVVNYLQLVKSVWTYKDMHPEQSPRLRNYRFESQIQGS